MNTIGLKGRLLDIIAQINNQQSLEKLLQLAEQLKDLENKDFQLSTEWKIEIDRRQIALENGSSVGRPLRQVLYKNEYWLPFRRLDACNSSIKLNLEEST